MDKERFWLSKEGIAATTLGALIAASLTFGYLADVKERRRDEDEQIKLVSEIAQLKAEVQRLKNSKPEAEPRTEVSKIEAIVKSFEAKGIKAPIEGYVFADRYRLNWHFENFKAEQSYSTGDNTPDFKFETTYKGHKIEITSSNGLLSTKGGGMHLFEARMYDKASPALDNRVREIDVYEKDVESKTMNSLKCCDDITDEELIDFAHDCIDSYDKEITSRQSDINAIMKNAMEAKAK